MNKAQAYILSLAGLLVAILGVLFALVQSPGALLIPAGIGMMWHGSKVAKRIDKDEEV